jgi:S1-C subfamily serine protease
MNRTADLVEIIRSKKVGDKLTIKLDREGEELEVTATLQARGR